jgi:hypothetical protein
MCVAGSLVLADAPPTNAKDIPATPSIGTDFLPRLRFEACFIRDMAKSSSTFDQTSDKGIALEHSFVAVSVCILSNAFETNFGR